MQGNCSLRLYYEVFQCSDASSFHFHVVRAKENKIPRALFRNALGRVRTRWRPQGVASAVRPGRGEGRGARGTLRPETREPGGGGGGSSLEGGGRFCSTIHLTSSASRVSYLGGGLV